MGSIGLNRSIREVVFLQDSFSSPAMALHWSGTIRSVHILLLTNLVTFVMIMMYRIEDAAVENNIDQLTISKSIDAEQHPDEPVYFDSELPLIWIGGVPRSGTTLMRAMLDAHSEVRCGEETHVIPGMLGMHETWFKSKHQMSRLEEAQIDEEVLNAALGAYLLSIIAFHGEPAANLCNKDPFVISSINRIQDIFPNSKFLLMIRDGRATAHSIVSRNVSIGNFDFHTYKGALRDWNKLIGTMYKNCMSIGEDVCMLVYYEQLVLHPETFMRQILGFLDIEWDDIVLHHEKTIGKDNGVSLSEKELSTDQVSNPVNTGALTKWVDYIPEDVKEDIDMIAPMLRVLGYDSHAYPPDYGKPDRQVMRNSKTLNENNFE